MALTVKINSIDKTSLIDWKSFQLINALTKEADIFSFGLKGKSYKPNLSDEVEIFDGATKIYGGIIIEIEEKIEALMKIVEITCKDYSHLLDRLLVARNYAKGRATNPNADDIVKDIISSFTTGFTTNNVVAPVKIESIQFNYDQVSKAIQMIAQQIDYDWYVDQNKDIHFFSKELSQAPFEINDSGGNLVWNSLVIQNNISQLKNGVWVRGGEKTDTKDWTQKTADGGQTIFQVGYSYNADTTFEVEKSTDGGSNWTPLSEGRDGVDDPDNWDILYNPAKMIIIFRENNKPASGNLIRWKGKITYPIIIYKEDQGSVATYGKFQFRELDKSIKSFGEAEQRALSILYKYSDKVHEGKFTTYEDGLKVGQKIRVNSTIRGIDDYFTITKMMTRVRNPATGERQYDVSLVGSEVVGILDVFIKLLVTDPGKNISILTNEIIDKITLFTEAMTLSDTLQALTKTSPPYKWAPDTNVLKWNFGTWS